MTPLSDTIRVAHLQTPSSGLDSSSSSSIQSWSEAVSRRSSENIDQAPDPAMIAYVQAKLALFDRMLYINVNGS